MERYNSDKEAIESHQQSFQEAMSSIRWMAVVWYVKDGEIHMRRTTNDFPTEDFDTSVAMLARDLADERGAFPATPGPLPLAPGFADLHTALQEEDKELWQEEGQ